MPTNKHWHEINGANSYPLADTATELSDGNVRLPSNVIVDLNVRYPAGVGNYPFVGAVSVTGTLVTVVVEAANSLSPDYGMQPLCVFSRLLSETEVGRQYALTSLQEGVGGWISFGEGIHEHGVDGVAPLSLRFSTPQQSLLCLKAARRYRVMPVRGLGSLWAKDTMSGIVNIAAESPLEVVKDSRTIGGINRDVVVVRLVRQEPGAGFDTSEQEQALYKIVRRSDLLQQFAGPCGKRPESHTCGNPEPIEFINSVAPDCDGILTLDFRNCASVSHVADPCTILLQCNFGISQVCPPPYIPDSEGRLPSEYDPVDINSVSETDPVPPEDDDESRVAAVDLPFVECFDSATVSTTIISGNWQVVSDDSPFEWDYCSENYDVDGDTVSVSETLGSYESLSVGSKNIAIWQSEEELNLGRVTTVDLKLTPGPLGSRRNGGIVLNYREHANISGRFVYHVVDVDYDTQTLSIKKFDGLTYIILASTPILSIYTDRWFRLIATVVEGPVAGQTSLSARLLDLEGSLDVSPAAVLTSNYAPSTGFNGVIADRAITRFAFFHYAEAP